MTASMLAGIFWALCFSLSGEVRAAETPSAEARPATQQPDFSPPPVPEFMLRKPAKPLTLEEMQQQADEAARRARGESDARAAAQKPPAKDDAGRLK